MATRRVNDPQQRRRARPVVRPAALIASSIDAIIATDLEGRVTIWNGAAVRLYGYAEAEMLGRPLSTVQAPGGDRSEPAAMGRARAGEPVEPHEAVHTRKDGTQIDVSISASPIADPSGELVGVATIVRDISKRVRYQDELRFLAEHDPLTGAGNRRRFERDLNDQVTRFRRYGEHASLLMIDIDGFKAVNDEHGHKAGDDALTQVAALLRERLRATDSVARIGGDEFAVLLPYATAEQAVILRADLARRIRELEIDVGGGTMISISASIGIAHVSEHTSGDELLRAADQAMYRHKPAGAPVAPWLWRLVRSL